MYLWKNKFKGKTPILISDSSSSSSQSSSSSSDDDDDDDRTRSASTYLSSVLSLFFPLNEQMSSSLNLKRIKCKNSESSNAKDRNGGDLHSPEYDDAIDLQTPMKHIPEINLDSVFISAQLYQFFQSCLPNIVKGCKWVLLYSTLKHGISLRTLIRNSNDLSGPCLLITGDTRGVVFGGLLNCPLTPTPTWKYQGTFQTFVFTTLYGPPTLFRPTGANRYFYMCLNDLLAFGGGGSFALRLNGDLLNGTSGPCDTFANQCLAHNEEFELKNVELWGFTHSSRYHN